MERTITTTENKKQSENQQPAQYFQVQRVNEERQLEIITVLAHSSAEAMAIARARLG